MLERDALSNRVPGFLTSNLIKAIFEARNIVAAVGKRKDHSAMARSQPLKKK
jgi:hypothetical protein